jgi:CDP-archaeol synthase
MDARKMARRYLEARKRAGGFVLAICAATVAGAILVGLSWTIGFVVGFSSMCGDLLSSFLKRRLGLPPSSRAAFLDQVPESFFPCLACRPMLQLAWADVAFMVLCFAISNMSVSKPLHWLKIRRPPY